MTRLALLACLAVVAACGSTSPLRRGAGMEVIHKGVVVQLEREGYKCEASPDKSYYDCMHAELTDVSFGYLPPSNLLQMWTVFRRDDEALVEKWRNGPCAPLHEDVAKVNDSTVIKLVCAESTFRFEMAVWVPENGLVDEDTHAIFALFRTIIAENIRGGGFLPPAHEVPPPATEATMEQST